MVPSTALTIRAVIMKIAESLGLGTYETSLTCYDLYNADECFMTGTGAEIVPVIKIDGRIVGDGKPGTITRKLINGFKELIM